MPSSKNSCSSAFRFPQKKIAFPSTACGFYAEHKLENHCVHRLPTCDSRPKTQSRAQREAIELQPQSYLIIHGDRNRRPSSTQSSSNTMQLQRTTQRPSTERLRIRPLSHMIAHDEAGSNPGDTDNYVPPNLIAKYTALIPQPEPVKPINNRDASTETSPPPIPKKELTGVAEYNKWVKETVEPFVSTLKSSIISAKPDNIAEYVSQYGAAVGSRRQLPRTLTKLEWEAEDTGLAGYFVGSGTAVVQDASPCSSGAQPLDQQPVEPNAEVEPCPQVLQGNADVLHELRSSWSCSQAKYNASLPREHVLKVNLDKTKWKTVMTIEPRTFYEKYLSQYPRDMLISDPVVLFSHKPVTSFAQAAEECKVMDVAIVPATEGTCVALTETYHDVASYHMLHADKNVGTGQFELSSNPVPGRSIPEEPAYAAARQLLMEYFKHNTAVTNTIKKAGIPKTDTKFLIAVVLFTVQDVDLLANSLASLTASGGDKNDVVIFLATGQAASSVSHLGVKRVVALPMLHQSIGSMDEKIVSHVLHRRFLQAWLAFTVADGGHPVLWQSPATIWLATPDKLRASVAKLPPVDTLWSFRGRGDPRASPFFSSFDFFWNNAKERPVHLLHEIMLHADLLVAWKSLDAVASYRLAENNARYGTSVHMFLPFDVLHSDVVKGDIASLTTAAQNVDKPAVLVISGELVVSMDIIESLKSAGLWFVK